MAFNPFHAFRKHQKVFLAALAIACMFLFVLTGSMATGFEFFQGLGQMFGFTAARSEQVATLYSKPIHQHELYQLRIQREIANLFVTNAIRISTDHAVYRINGTLPNTRFSSQDQDQIKRILQQNPNERGWYYDNHLRMLENIRRNMPDPQRMPDADVLNTLTAVLNQDRHLLLTTQLSMGSGSQGLFFGGGLDGKGLLDFMIWRRQADELGIQLSNTDISTLVKQLTPAGWPGALIDRLQLDLRRRYNNLTSELLFTALGDEFRVRLAQESLLGMPVDLYPHAPLATAMTPFDLWSYYREQRAENSIALLPIPVHHADFLNKAGEPTEPELKELYEKNKDRLYDPSSEGAGFKQPGRYQVEWVSAAPDSPKLQQIATSALAGLQGSRVLEIGAALAQPSGNIAGTLLELGRPSAQAIVLEDQYNRDRYRFRSPAWLGYDFVFHDTSANHPWPIAGAAAGKVGALATGAPAILQGLGVYLANATQNEARGRMQTAATLVLSGASAASLGPVAGVLPGGDVITPVVPLAFARAALPESLYLPLERVKPLVQEELHKRMTRDIARTAIAELSQDLRKRTRMPFPSADERSPDSVRAKAASLVGLAESGPVTAAALSYQDLRRQAVANAQAVAGMVLGWMPAPSPIMAAALWYRDRNLPVGDAREKVNAAVARLGLKRGATSKPHDQYEVAQDPGLAPLKAAMNQPWPQMGSGQKTDRQVGTEIYNYIQRDQPYTPHEAGSPFGNDEQFLFWKTAEQGEFTPAFDDIKDKVKARWLAEKARSYAEEEAKRVAEHIRQMNVSGEEAARSLREASKYGGPIVDLENVAPLEKPRQVMPSRAGSTFAPYQIPEAKVEYPGDMAKKLFELRKPGDAVVVHDQPRDHYYVAVLRYRTPVYPLSFFADAAEMGKRSMLAQRYETDTKQRAKQLESVLDQMRTQAGLVVNEEKLKEFMSAASAET
jgi:hypothetical protein